MALADRVLQPHLTPKATHAHDHTIALDLPPGRHRQGSVSLGKPNGFGTLTEIDVTATQAATATIHTPTWSGVGSTVPVMQQTQAAPPATLDAVLERITYANQETGYTVRPGGHRPFQ